MTATIQARKKIEDLTNENRLLRQALQEVNTKLESMEQQQITKTASENKQEEWATTVDCGQIVSIIQKSSSSGTFYIIKIERPDGQLVKYQAWNTAAKLITCQKIVEDDWVVIHGYTHYFEVDGKNYITLKTSDIQKVGSMTTIGTIDNSGVEKSSNKDTHQFTLKESFGNNNVVICNVDKSNEFTSDIVNGNKVKIVGTHNITNFCPSKLELNVQYGGLV